MSGAGLRLDFDFTPLFMSGASIRKAAKGRWPGIRRRLLADQGSVCEACGFIAQEARLIHGHEVFEYDLAAKKVRLIRIALLCFKCHNCKHFEHFSVLHGLGTFTSQNPEDLIAHFCTVNGCSRSDFEAHFRAATERRELLDSTFGANFQGEIDYGVYAEAVAQAKTRRARFPRKEKPKKPVVLTPEQEQKLAEWRAIRDKWQADYDASLRWHEIFSGLSRKRDARIVAVITGVSKHRPAGFKLFYVDEEVASLGDRFLTRPGLRERGWTDGQIRRLLNTCDVAPRRNAMDAPLYAEARVAALEKANTKVRDGVRLRRADIARCEKAVRKAIA